MLLIPIKEPENLLANYEDVKDILEHQKEATRQEKLTNPRKAFIDLITFSVPIWYFKNNTCPIVSPSNCVTFRQYGNTVLIDFHGELFLDGIPIGQQVLWALVCSVFEHFSVYPQFYLWSVICNGNADEIMRLGGECFLQIFTVHKVEYALDTFVNPISFPAEEDFIKTSGSTYYSRRDFSRSRRKSGQRKYETKAKQPSLICVYDRDKKIAEKSGKGRLDYSMYRIEYRMQGKYRKYLKLFDWGISVEENIKKMVPLLSSFTRKLLRDKHTAFSEIELLKSGSLLWLVLSLAGKTKLRGGNIEVVGLPYQEVQKIEEGGINSYKPYNWPEKYAQAISLAFKGNEKLVEKKILEMINI